MLESALIICPKCDRETEVGISIATGPDQTFSSTSRRRCGARFIVITTPDRQVYVVDADSPEHPVPMVAEPAPGRSAVRSSPSLEPPKRLRPFDRCVPDPDAIMQPDLHGCGLRQVQRH
jgi:hypothetical protein